MPLKTCDSSWNAEFYMSGFGPNIDDEASKKSLDVSVSFYRPRKDVGFHNLRKNLMSEIQELIQSNLPTNVFDWGVGDKGVWWFNLRHVWIRFHPAIDSKAFMVPELIPVSRRLTSRCIAHIKKDVEELINCHGPRLTCLRALAVMILQAVEATSIGCRELVGDSPQHDSGHDQHRQIGDQQKHDIPSMSLSVECTTTDDILGVTAAQIYAMIPPMYCVTAIQTIRRKDLTQSWLQYRDILKDRASQDSVKLLWSKIHPHSFKDPSLRFHTKLQLVEALIKPFITFHGTSRSIVTSIIEHGFLLPGTMVNGRPVVSPRNNIIYDGRGMYSSQSPHYALSYSICHSTAPMNIDELPGTHLFVCATLMGRTMTGYAVHGPLQDGYDAHFDDGWEYIVHDTRAMLPCYLVHLINRNDRAKTKAGHTDGRPLSMAQPIITKRELKSVVSKGLPYGFGCSEYVRVVAEEIAAVDEDEEPYGTWYYDYLVQILAGLANLPTSGTKWKVTRVGFSIAYLECQLRKNRKPKILKSCSAIHFDLSSSTGFIIMNKVYHL